MSDETKVNQEDCVPIKRALVLCSDPACHRMFQGIPSQFKDDLRDTLLPCGHKIGSILFSGVAVKDANRKAELFDWLDKNDLIVDCVPEAIRAAGGVYDRKKDQVVKMPDRDLTDDEKEEIITMPHLNGCRLLAAAGML